MVILQTRDTGRTWQVSGLISTPNAALDVLSINAIDSLRCYVTLTNRHSRQVFLVFTDDGKNWTTRPLPFADQNVRKSIFLSSNNGCVLVQSGSNTDRILYTGDLGESWTSAGPGFPGNLADVAFYDPYNGWATADSKSPYGAIEVYRTIDGGRHWKLSRTIDPDKSVGKYAVRVINSRFDQHLILGHHASLITAEELGSFVAYSRDNGKSYDVFEIEYQPEPGLVVKPVLDDLKISAEKSLWAVNPQLNEWESGYALIRSVDSGKSWEKRYSFSEPVTAVLFPSDLAGVCVTDGKIMHSADEGASWSPATIEVCNRVPNIENELMVVQEDPYLDGAKQQASLEISDVEEVQILLTKPLDAQIDSAYTSRLKLGWRGWGAWHTIRNLAGVDNASIREHQTIRLAGEVQMVKGKKIQKALWESDINGTLSEKIAFTTLHDQLSAGSHRITFRVMDELGQWSTPATLNLVVEPFPIVKLPFHGSWIIGGAGSYYNRRYHVGNTRYALDMNIPGGEDYGIPIRASTNGKVIFAGYRRGGYGRMIKIEYHYAGKKYVTSYAHLGTISVSVGDIVSQGQEIGTCGNTGWSSGPHLHWELWEDDRNVPPEPVFLDDLTVIQEIQNGKMYASDNHHEPKNVLIVDEGDISNTYFDRIGYGHSKRWTISNKNTRSAEAVWVPEIKKTGVYRIEVHIPRNNATAYVRYRIHQGNLVTVVPLSQYYYYDQWVSLGNFYLEKKNQNLVTMDNVTGRYGRRVAFDAVRFVGPIKELTKSDVDNENTKFTTYDKSNLASDDAVSEFGALESVEAGSGGQRWDLPLILNRSDSGQTQGIESLAKSVRFDLTEFSFSGEAGWAVRSVTGENTIESRSALELIYTNNYGASWKPGAFLALDEGDLRGITLNAIDSVTCILLLENAATGRSFLAWTENRYDWNVIPIDLDDVRVKSMSFQTRKRGLLVVRLPNFEDRVYFTIDGGETWEVSDLDFTGAVQGLSFYSPFNGLLVGDSKTNHGNIALFRTIDGGKHWSADSEIAASGMKGRYAVTIHAPRFDKYLVHGMTVDVTTGESESSFLAVSTNPEKKLAVETITYSPVPGITIRPTAELIAPVNSGQLWAVNNTPNEWDEGFALLYSENTGKTWKRIYRFEDPIHTLMFSDENHGVCSDFFGNIFVTEDAGKTWIKSRLNSDSHATAGVQEKTLD